MGLFNWLFGRPAPARRDDADGPRARGVAHLARGEYAEAAAALREALAIRPDDADVRKALAACCRALGDDAAAADEAALAKAITRRAAEWWAHHGGQPLPLVWEGESVGHFTLGHADDYPRLKGRWEQAVSPQGRRFAGILQRRDYDTRPDPLRVSLGAGVGGEFLVSGVSVVVDDGGNQEAILLDLTVVTPPQARPLDGD